VPVLPVSLIAPIWAQFAVLLPDHPEVDPAHPLGCHRRRVPDRVVFDHIVAALVHGSGYERIATPGCSDRTVRRRVREWAEQKGMTLATLAEHSGLSPSHLSRIERGLTMPSYDVLARIAAALGTDLTTLTAEETATKAVDADLDAILEQSGVSPESRADLLRLKPSTRADLARVLAGLNTAG
jgi:transcriptional regulator with XRE-family HTH domain